MKNHEQFIVETMDEWDDRWVNQVWVKERSGLVVVNMLGQLACTEGEGDGVIQISDSWGNTALIPKPEGRFAVRHLLPQIQKREEWWRKAGIDDADKDPRINKFAACWMFLDRDITPQNISDAVEFKIWRHSGWSANGRDVGSWEHLGAKIPVTIDEKDLMLGVMRTSKFKGTRDEVRLGWR